MIIGLKNKSYFASKNGLIQDKHAIAKAIGKFNKQKKGMLFYGEKGRSWEE